MGRRATRTFHAELPPEPYIGCTVKELPPEEHEAAAEYAAFLNPANRLPAEAVSRLKEAGVILTAGHLAVLTSKYWGAGGVRLTVGFLEQTPGELVQKIIEHANAWATVAGANVQFTYSQSEPVVRVTREQEGYWSYLGTDVARIPRGQPTMCLQQFSLRHPEREFTRVVRHEFGHTLGFPHEHARDQIVARLDVEKTVAYFKRTQGWDEQTTREQVLKPLSAASIRGTPAADDDSIMCYPLPAAITTDGQPVPGGKDFTPEDMAFARQCYPRPSAPTEPGKPTEPTGPTEPAKPPGGESFVTITVKGGRVEINGRPI
jgi:hypothetical protein